MEKKIVSILVVSFNAEKYIKKTIDSCLNQTYENVEVLLLDNASKDKTVEIAEKMQLSDMRLKIFESEKNLGPYGGLNFLLDKTKREYVAIQDHDDIWFPEKIKKQVEFLENNSDFIACGTNTFYYFESKEVLILNKKPAITNFADHPSLMFRNNNLRYNENYLLADEYFEKQILSGKGKIACLQEPLTIHRIKYDSTNLSSDRFKISIKNVKEFFKVNKLNFSNFLYFIDLSFSKYLPKKVLWLVRKKITLRNAEWISMADFQKRFPEIAL